jgi:hypothetical protein
LLIGHLQDTFTISTFKYAPPFILPNSILTPQQNVRNNKNHRRTPKWAQRYGLVDTTKIQRDERKSQWASRYNDRLPQSTLDSQPYEEGQESRLSTDEGDAAKQQHQENAAFWRPEDESFYGTNNGGAVNSASTAESTGRWRYPANFEDTIDTGEVPKRSRSKKKEKKDRWARTEDAYSLSEEQGKKKKSKKKKSKSSDSSLRSGDSTTEFPEDPEGGLYGNKLQAGQPGAEETGATQTADLFEHQF